MKKKTVQEETINEIDPYKVDKLAKVPTWLIVLILKYWAAAAAVFFILNGGTDIGLTFSTSTDPVEALATDILIIILLGLFLALFASYIVRPIVRLTYNRRNNTYRYNMVNTKGFKAFLLNLVYMFVLSIVLYFISIYFLSPNHLVWDPFGTTGGIGIEPFTYGLWFIIVDTICVIIKDVIIMIVQRIKYKKQILGD